jgi:hypothetical protein
LFQIIKDDIFDKKFGNSEKDIELLKKDVENFKILKVDKIVDQSFSQKFWISTVESIHSRFQDSFESVKTKVQVFLDTTLGNISLCIFDSMIDWVETDFDEAIVFSEVRKYFWFWIYWFANTDFFPRDV